MGAHGGSSRHAPDAITSHVEVIAVNTGSRGLDASHAADRVAQAAAWLKAAGCQRFYLKIDSTLRGNAGAEVWRLLHALGLELAIVAPAFPEAGRVTIGGFQLVGGVPVALSSYGRDPLGPVEESHLPTLLQAGGCKTELIDLRTVLGGWEKIVGAVAEARARGVKALVLDAARPEDLESAGRAIAHLGDKLLPVGSAGLAQALRISQPGAGRLLGASVGPSALSASGLASEGAALPGTPGLLRRSPPVLVLSGSANPVTLQQLTHLEAGARILALDVRRLLLVEGPSRWPASPSRRSRTGRLRRDAGTRSLHDEVEIVARQALQNLLAGRDVVVTTARTEADVERDQALGRELGLTSTQVGDQLTGALGALARRLLSKAAVSGVVVAGGETAAAVCHHLGADRLAIAGEMLPAIPLLKAIDRDLAIVTKSGGFGSPDALLRLVERLRLPGEPD